MTQHSTTKNPSDAPKFGRLTDAAKIANCSEKTIRRYIAQGLLTGYRIGPRQIRIDLNELDALFTTIPTAGN